MAKITVRFHRCVHDAQEYGSDDQHMVSRVFFTLQVDRIRQGDFYADVKQLVGSDLETGPLEVSPPVGYEGSFNHEEFSRATEAYFRGLVGSSGSGIRIQGGSRVRMHENVSELEREVTFEAR